mgnify:CR=1 FL=1
MKLNKDEKIRIRLESFNHELLNSSCEKIISIIENYNLSKFSLVSLPTDKRIYCVLRSPHVNKDSREHFEIRIHKRILDIYYDQNINISDFINKLKNLSSGIKCLVVKF